MHTTGAELLTRTGLTRPVRVHVQQVESGGQMGSLDSFRPCMLAEAATWGEVRRSVSLQPWVD